MSQGQRGKLQCGKTSSLSRRIGKDLNVEGEGTKSALRKERGEALAVDVETGQSSNQQCARHRSGLVDGRSGSKARRRYGGDTAADGHCMDNAEGIASDAVEQEEVIDSEDDGLPAALGGGDEAEALLFVGELGEGDVWYKLAAWRLADLVVALRKQCKQ